MANERDTHFQNAAKLLWHEVRKTSFDSPGFSEYQQLERHLQTLFARFLYDFAMHNAESLDPLQHGVDSAYVAWLVKTVASIPDLTVWPSPSPPAEIEHEP